MIRRSQKAECIAASALASLALLRLVLACSSNSTPINPPVIGWNCSVTVAVNGETEENFIFTPASTSATSDSLLYGDGGVACPLTASSSDAIVTLSGSTCSDPAIKSLLMTWSVNAGTITGSATGKNDGGTESVRVVGSCTPMYGSP